MPLEDKAQEIKCPHCGRSDPCNPEKGIKRHQFMFVLVQNIPTNAPLYLIDGNAVIDTDEEDLDWEARTYEIGCLSCGKSFPLPESLKAFTASDRNEIINMRPALLERIRKQEVQRGQDKKA
jgi:hypothetical protein